jgi:hypothetical protein
MFIVLALAFSANSHAVSVRGAPSCGNWITERSSANKWYGIANNYWLNGYLSSYAKSTSQDILKNMDNEAVKLWMDNYCKEHPLSEIDDGADLLIKQLMMKSKP